MTDTTTFSWDSLPKSNQRPPVDLLCGRYELGPSMAIGGHGQVLSATDRYGDAEIVVKMEPVRSKTALNRVRREITALRMLRMPGVVTLLDDGVIHGQHFIVMERVEGQTFPIKAGWDTALPLMLDLLETLRAIHASGIVHRDLKPQNIMVSQGRTRLIDFGLARVQRLGLVIEGTPHYMAPEQITGAHQDHRVDLYAVGVMLYEVLCGFRPHRGSAQQITASRPARPATPLLKMEPNIKPSLAVLVDELLSIDPDRRPATAEEVARRLGGDSLTWQVQELTQHLPRRCDALDLEPLFHGPELFFHLKTDPAAALHAQTEGVRPKVAKRLERWIRGGYCHLDGDTVSITRLQLERLALPIPSVDQNTETLLAQLVAQAQEHQDRGHGDRACASLIIVLALARQQEDPDRERVALEQLCVAALATERGRAIDQALAQVGQSEERGLAVNPLRLLLRGGLFAERGESLRALECLDELEEFQDEGLELWRVGARVRALLQEGEAQLEQLEQLEQPPSWAHTPERRARLLGWWGHYHYQRGSYEQALQSHLLSLQLRTTARGRLTSMHNAASAAKDARAEQAPELIQAVLAQSKVLRNPRTEASAWCMQRSWAQSQGFPVALHPEALETALHISVSLAMSLAVVDLVTAWLTRPPQATQIAAQAVLLCERVGFSDGATACRAALHDLGVEQPGVLAQVREIRLDNLRLEALAMLAPHFPEQRLKEEVCAVMNCNEFPLDQHLTFMTPRQALARC